MPAEVITVCVPSWGYLTLDWALAMNRLTAQTTRDYPDVTLRFHGFKGFPVDEARNRLIARSRLPDKLSFGEVPANRVFFVDDDVIIPPNGLSRLISVQDKVMAEDPSQGLIVAGLYWLKTRTDGKHDPGALMRDEATHAYLPYKPAGVEACDAVPMGCTLIHTSLFDNLPKPYYDWTSKRGAPGMSEDVYFCDNAWRNLGTRPIIVPDVKCEHVTMAKLRDGVLDI